LIDFISVGSLSEGFTYNFEMAYFQTDCASVLARSQEVTEAFLSALASWKVCVSGNGTSTCRVEDTAIACGQVNSDLDIFSILRNKRAAEKKLVISFNVKSLVASTNCSAFCEAEITEQCLEDCKIAMTNEANTTVQDAASKIESIFGSPEQQQDPQALVAQQSLQPPSSTPEPLPAAAISIPGVTLTPIFGTLRHDLKTQCPPGTRHRSHICGMQSRLVVFIPLFLFLQWNAHLARLPLKMLRIASHAPLARISRNRVR
jgi:hypothetical protein